MARDPETGELCRSANASDVCRLGRAVDEARPGRWRPRRRRISSARWGWRCSKRIEPEQIIAALVASDPGADRRQVAVVDAQGRAAAHTGANCIQYASHHVGEGYTVQANMMTRSTVIPAMVEAFESATGDLAVRMMAALYAAQAEDGDIRGMQSAALKIVSGDRSTPAWDVIYDLRVDEHERPLDELARLVRLRRAAVVDERGHEALTAGKREEALALWQQAREIAPEMEEIPFWQAMNLADELQDHDGAAAVLRPVFERDPRRDEWVDLIRRWKHAGCCRAPERRSRSSRDWAGERREIMARAVMRWGLRWRSSRRSR